MTSADRVRDEEPVAHPDPGRGTPSFEEDLAALKQKLITMAGRVENMVNQAIKGFLLRQEDLGVRIKREDAEVNRFEMDIDELAVQLLEKVTRQQDRRLLVVAMKISGELERVGDEATTIARRAQELTREPFRESAVELLAITTLALGMFEDALEAFTTRDPARARLVIPRDAEVDFLHKGLHGELMNSMMAQPALIPGCLHLMVISKCLERIADHATNVAEEVVYLYEGQDIRHGGKTAAAKV